MIDDEGSAALDSGDPVIGALKRVFADLPRAETDATTDDPTTIGRYAVLRRVGSGATGVVYAAYDEELDRRVAIKLMRDRGARVSGAAARLRREAQALARISHPNVIGVHEVGEHRASDVEQVFIAMEFVRGQTLRRWCSAAGRTHREVIDVLLQAARGLAAVHDAGLVHRDVKPENVMIGDDGRVRLMDFGLARGDPHEQPRTSPNVELGPAAVQITRSGAIAGTPAYMAPEQWSGGDVGTAADQFAFCVMAWEALYGARPFEDATVDTLAKTVREGPKQRGPGGTTVPARVRRILERGLAAAPADRWSSMGALLEALARVQRQAGRMRLIVLASVVALVVVGIAGAHRIDVMRRTAACEEAGSRDVAAWDDENRTAVRVSLSSTGVPYAADTADRVIPWLDERASALERGRTEACLDADVRGTWDAETFDRSSWCLDDQRSELEAIVHELAHADAQTVQHAVTAVAALPDPAWCRDVDRLSRLPAPPPEDRDDVNAIRRELARAGALERAGRYATALEVVDPALARARESSWTPLVAAALARRAALLHRLADYADAEATGREAYLEAARVGAWDIAAEVASELVAVVGAGLSRVDEGLFWGRHAEIALAHAGDPQQLAEARRLAAVATVFNGVARHEEARVASERALEINRAALAPNHRRSHPDSSGSGTPISRRQTPSVRGCSSKKASRSFASRSVPTTRTPQRPCTTSELLGTTLDTTRRRVLPGKLRSRSTSVSNLELTTQRPARRW